MSNAALLTISDKAMNWGDCMAVGNRKNWNMEKQTSAAGRPGIRSPIQFSKPKVTGAWLTIEVVEIKRIKHIINPEFIPSESGEERKMTQLQQSGANFLHKKCFYEGISHQLPSFKLLGRASKRNLKNIFNIISIILCQQDTKVICF